MTWIPTNYDDENEISRKFDEQFPNPWPQRWTMLDYMACFIGGFLSAAMLYGIFKVAAMLTRVP